MLSLAAVGSKFPGYGHYGSLTDGKQMLRSFVYCGNDLPALSIGDGAWVKNHLCFCYLTIMGQLLERQHFLCNVQNKTDIGPIDIRLQHCPLVLCISSRMLSL